jgi:hypothetical protein
MPPTKGEIMEPLVLNMRLSGQATQPAGEPPQADVQGEAESVTVERGEGAGIDVVAYKNHVTFTGETSFTESGRISVGHNGDALMISTVGEGYIAPSADPSVLHGAVIWRIDKGEGAFEGASGLVTSNFQLRPDTGDISQHQVAVIFR